MPKAFLGTSMKGGFINPPNDRSFETISDRSGHFNEGRVYKPAEHKGTLFVSPWWIDFNEGRVYKPAEQEGYYIPIVWLDELQ